MATKVSVDKLRAALFDCALRFTRRTLMTQRNAVSVKTLFNQKDRDEILVRMQALRPEHAVLGGVT